MKKDRDPWLESLALGALPLVNRFLDRLGVQQILGDALGPVDGRTRLCPAQALGVFIRNILLSRHPLYELSEWASTFVPQALGLCPDELKLLNDDRIGRCLDRLFEADRAALVSGLVLALCEEFDLKMDVLHNDSTSITFTGRYPQRRGRSGRDTLHITHGFNKDYRPDLRQLVWELTVSEDGAVPVLVGLHDGNESDSNTHLPTWKRLREIVGRASFLYVADSKLCCSETMSYIHGQGGRFVTVLPATRKEERRFKEWIQDHVVPWQDVWRRPPLRRRSDPSDVFRGFDSPIPSAEGFRIVWYHSSIKQELDQTARQSRMDRAVAELEFLKNHRLGVRRLKTVEQVQQAAQKILEQVQAQRWIEVVVEAGEKAVYRQAGPGRPGKNTQYRREMLPKPRVTWKMCDDAIAWDAKTDGLFPLITTEKEATKKQILLWYKYQPRLEKRFEQLKTVMQVRPVCLKSPQRVEAYLLLYYIALIVETLMERELRKQMKAQRIPMLPLYPEKRKCKAPTAERILELFSNMRRHRLMVGEQEQRRFHDKLTPLQRRVLRLLAVPTADYTK